MKFEFDADKLLINCKLCVQSYCNLCGKFVQTVWHVLIMIMPLQFLVEKNELPLMLSGYGTETYTSQTKSRTCPANTGKDSRELYTHFICLLLLIELCMLSILLCSTSVWNFSFVVKLVQSSILTSLRHTDLNTSFCISRVLLELTQTCNHLICKAIILESDKG